MSKSVSYHQQMRLKSYSKSQIPELISLNQSIGYHPNNNDNILNQITLDFGEKLNNLQLQIDNLRMEFNAQFQSLSTHQYQPQPQPHPQSYDFDSYNPQRKYYDDSLIFDNSLNHNHKFIINKIDINQQERQNYYANLNNKIKTPKKITTNEKIKGSFNYDIHRKGIRNHLNLLNFFSIKSDDKEKIKRLIIDATPQIRLPSDYNVINKSYQQSKVIALKRPSAPETNHTFIKKDKENLYSNKKVKTLSTIIIHNDIVPLTEKIKIMFLCKEIKKHHTFNTLYNSSLSFILKKIDSFQPNHSIPKDFPSKPAMFSLNFLTSSNDIFFQEQLEEKNKEVSTSLYQVIYLLLNKKMPNKQSSKEHYDGLMTAFNINTFKSLFMPHIIQNINSKIDSYTIDTKNTVIKMFEQLPILITPTLKDMSEEYKPLAYISMVFNEINALFTSDISRVNQLFRYKQELVLIKNLGIKNNNKGP